MPNGNPGDHPLTDILVHRLRVYGQEADELIRKIAELSSRRELDEWWEKGIGWSPEHDLVVRKARMRFDELFEHAKRSVGKRSSTVTKLGPNGLTGNRSCTFARKPRSKRAGGAAAL